MDLQEFLTHLPDEWVLAPIYRKDAPMKSGRLGCGKNPYEPSFDKAFNKHDAALAFAKNTNLGALGLFTGVRGGGIVILDCDANLGVLQRKWGDSLDGAPMVTSTRANAAKYIFRVPEALWGEVTGFGHSDQHCEGYEVLWGAQGLIYGEYPGSKDGKWGVGHYSFNGDPDNVPEAPPWLIAEMKAAQAPLGFIKNKSALDVSDRTPEEVAEIVNDCLSVIENRGVGQRDHWVKIGMAIHSVLPNDVGLDLWSQWSAKDSEFAHEWAKSNPCEQTWKSFKPGQIGLGSLIWQADRADPKRTRFDENIRKIVESAEAAVVRTREVCLSFEEVIERGMKIYEGDDVARMNYELHSLAMECRYKDQSGVEKLLLDHMTQKSKGKGHTMAEVTFDKRDYLIPGLLPTPYSILFFGEGGSGKSATAIALMKHVVDGIPFPLKNQLVPVKRGPVVYFNGDMSEQDFKSEFDLHEIKNVQDFYFEPDFNLYRRMQFVKTMNEVKPVMICIDSLSSCSGAKAGDENKAEFAQPLYWLNNSNGTLWPACTIIVLHHAAKHGGYRGSTAITAAVSEVWHITEPKKDSGLSADQRVITIGKSRMNRKGETLIQSQMDDLTVQIKEIKQKEEVQTKAGTVADRIMNRLQTCEAWMTRSDLNSDPLVGGSVAAIRKTLQRLEDRGVVETKEEKNPDGGKPVKFFRVLLAHGESQQVGQQPQTPSENRASAMGQTSEEEPTSESCPIVDFSAGAPSDGVDEGPLSSRARTDEELRSMRDQSFWD